MTCKGYYRISIVLAFSCGREKTIRIRCVCVAYFFANGKKLSVFKNIWICVDEALIMRTKVYLCKSADVVYIMYVMREEQNV